MRSCLNVTAMIAYAALELMNDNYDSHVNKDIIVSVVPKNVWSEIQLADRERCYEMFIMRRSVFHLLHETF
jgi:hypothetical protein